MNQRLEMVWQVVVRMVVGTYWLYFSLMKWFDRSWVSDLLSSAANGNYVPGYGYLLKFAASNSGSIAIFVTILETVIGSMILLGILTRVGAALGTALGLNLLFTFAFCKCTQTDFPLVFWFYLFPIILNLQLIFDKSDKVFGLRRIMEKVRGSVT